MSSLLVDLEAYADVLAEAQRLGLLTVVPRWLPRPEQMPPPGDWRVWLIMAGRGWGKTRTGAEWTIASARDYPLTNIIGATTDDARDIMIEGESGIMACVPADFRPRYKPGLRRLDWPNGGRSLIFTADEPERLRGKQHMRLWCLTGDTGVLMADGEEIPLRDVRVGDWVQTRRGPQRVTGSLLTKRNAHVFRVTTVDGRSIIGTADHPVWVDGRGFLPLGSLTVGMDVCVSNVSSGAARRGTATMAATTPRSFACTAKSGKRSVVRSLTATTSITSTATRATIVSTISRSSRIATTAPHTSRGTWGHTATAPWRTLAPRLSAAARSAYGVASSAVSAAWSTTAARSIRAGSALANAWNPPALARSAVRIGAASSAAMCITLPNARSGIVPSGAIGALLRLALPTDNRATYNAPSAARRSPVFARTRDSVPAPAPSLSTQTIASVERLATPADVYDIAVEHAREFFANGILVHNCDEVAAWRRPEAYDQAMFGLRLGSDPRACVTTTPKPVKLIRELMAASTTAITRGNTYDNRANLAPAFFEQIITKYEGTRLGRQELLGEYLDDTPGALWTRAMFEPRRTPPDLARVVVAVDPATTATEESDETGIVVCGRGVDGRGYVLADRSCRLGPAEWARRAIAAFREFQADRIVYEANQGGDMVGHTLRMVDRGVPLTAVHASRGKRVRAEPVAALYEQVRVSHVAGADLDALEDQLVGWTPDSGDSPDRLDALVWGLTELLVQRHDVNARAI